MQRRKRSWHHVVLALVAATLVSSIQGQDAATAAPAVANPATVAAAFSAVTNSTDDMDGGPRISCRVHVVNNTESSITYSHVQSSLKIPSAADVTDVSVIVQVQHPDVAELEVVLTAAASSGSSSKVILKSPAVGVMGGPNMVQTIFSDWAPVPFPSDASEAPYSSVYRPVQPFRTLVAGNSTAAGAGGSKGVWTLSVTDKASGDLSRRPLKLTGWELWLCGESNGPLFAPVDNDDKATAFDGADIAASVVKKAVPSSKAVDVNVLVKAGYRAEQVASDPVNHVIQTVNAYLAKGLAAHFEKAKESLEKASPELAAHLSDTMAKVQNKLQGMPGLMGYMKNGDGTWSLPTSEAMIQGFLDTLTHCYYDLYWCWENTGIHGNLALDFASTWDAASGPVASGWSAMQKEWSKALGGFDAAFPGLNSWSDTLFYSVINLLYDAAAADAVATVGEAYFDTALRLAIYASPIRFAVNPRAAIVQTFSVVADAINDVFLALEFAPDVLDNDNNNNEAAVTGIANALSDATTRTLGLLTDGLNTRAEAMRQSLVKSAGGLANKAADVNDKLREAISQLSPDLGDMFKAATEPTSDVLRSIAQNRQDALKQYFQNSNYLRELSPELSRSVTLAGNVTRAMVKQSAEAFKSASKALDDVLPGPPLHTVLSNLRGNITGILDDARKALENLIPIPELQELDQLMKATVDSIVELLNESAKEVQNSDGAKAIQKQLNRLADGLNQAQRKVGDAFTGIAKGVPGPMLNSTISTIQRQANKAISDLNDMFKRLNKDYPNIDPEHFIKEVGKSLDGLLSDTLQHSNALSALAPMEDASKLSAQIPRLLKPVSDAIQTGQKLANTALPSSIRGDTDVTKLSEIQKGLTDTLRGFSERANAITSSLPLQPAVSDITDNLGMRAQQIHTQQSQLMPAIVDALRSPQKIASAGVSDLNNNLEGLLKDLDSQSSRRHDLGKMLAKGPLANIPKQLNHTFNNVKGGFEGAAKQLDGLLPGLPELPDLPDLRKQLNTLLGPPLRDLDAQLQLAGQEAVKAATSASQGLVAGLAGALKGINKLLIDGQWQLASLLGSLVQTTQQLNTAAAGLDKVLAPQMDALDKGMAYLAKNVSTDLQNRLEALLPPTQVLENLIRPLAATLNDQLGNITKSLKGPNVQSAVNTALQQMQGVAGALINGTSGALNLPPLPELPPLPALPPPPGKKNETGSKPSKGDSSSKKDDSSKKHDSSKKDDKKGSKDKGRHLLQVADEAPATLLEVAFSIPDLSSLTGNGSSFEPAAFRQAVVSGVEDAVNSFANDFVGSVLGMPGVSQLDGVNSVMQSLGSTVNDAVKQLRDSAAALPKGPVFEFLTTGNTEALQPLQQLQQTLVTAMNGAEANGTAVDPAELAQLFKSAGSTLQALSGSVQQMGRTANSGDVIQQLAQQFTTVADAAGKMLQGMKSNLQSLSAQSVRA